MENKPPAQLVKDMHEVTGQIVDLHGGNWTYNDGKTMWEKDRTDGYGSEPCSVEGAQRFSLSILGPPVDSPKAAVDKVKAHFTERDFTVTNQFDSTLGKGRHIVVSMVDETGTEFVYKPGTHTSSLVVNGECSTHPDMDQVTK